MGCPGDRGFARRRFATAGNRLRVALERAESTHQVDRPTGHRKYVIRGRPLEGDDAVVAVAKVGRTGKVVFLTVYSE